MKENVFNKYYLIFYIIVSLLIALFSNITLLGFIYYFISTIFFVIHVKYLYAHKSEFKFKKISLVLLTISLALVDNMFILINLVSFIIIFYSLLIKISKKPFLDYAFNFFIIFSLIIVLLFTILTRSFDELKTYNYCGDYVFVHISSGVLESDVYIVREFILNNEFLTIYKTKKIFDSSFEFENILSDFCNN